MNSKKMVRVGTGKSGGVAIPRYENPNFRQIETPNSTGKIKRYTGGKLFKDGVVRYPSSANVDPIHAAKVQALMDYNSSNGRPAAREDMVAIYGEAYTKEFARLGRVARYDEK